MNKKIISLNNLKVVDGKVLWNHPAFNTEELITWLLDAQEKYAIPGELHKICLEYLDIRNNGKGWSIDKSIKDILETLPPKQEWELFWRYLNHLSILKIDVLINLVYRVGYKKPQKIVDLLARLVRHANDSSAPCFKVSVHYACKFFLSKYPEYADEIGRIIANEKKNTLINKFDRGVDG